MFSYVVVKNVKVGKTHSNPSPFASQKPKRDPRLRESYRVSHDNVHFYYFYFSVLIECCVTVRYNKIQYKVKIQRQNLPRVDQNASRILKMYCMKSQQIRHRRAVLSSTANSGRFAKIGQNWQCQLAGPFHALFARISCNTFLESLKHTDQPWVVFVSRASNFIKNGLNILC